MATKTAPSIAVPGQFIGPTSKYQAGPGTHVYESNVYSSLLGVVQVTQPAKPPGPPKRLNIIVPPQPTAPPFVSVSPSGVSDKREVLPEVGNVVLCRVTSITPRQAVVTILICGDSVLEAEWRGVIRAQDVRATEKDKVKIYESFRPGDIVRAEVISLGDQASYYLQTAKNELGVIMATSEAGNTMYPVSWKEYRDAETGMSEPRKVAKP
ncbi:exosome component 1 [Echria macrotheca]|uniref:Exosome component 1 n=1 Tax=Echria macrotheca TaxID=438768 RepID=A0AAJ0FH84_9PEZI|nr:exosome component 1 [Echria macrotheca]